MAGAGYKLFVNGNTLSASDLNTYVQQQTVMVFATTGARDSALSGVLAEGMQCYIIGTGGFYYNGSAWIANVTPTSTTTLTNKTLTAPVITYSIYAQTASYTAAASDAAAIVTMSVGSSNAFSIPTNASVPFAIGSQITVIQIGAGQTTISAVTPGTTTVASVGGTSASPKLRTQYSSATAIKVAADSWYIVGDII